MKKRLFIFAGYDKEGIVDSSLLYYIKALSQIGDVVFHMDNDAAESEVAKIREIPNVLHAAAARHGEHDFGSYKRGFFWAKDQDILKDYEWVYFVNDSVYGPFKPLEPILNDLESRGKDVIGMCKYHNNDKGELIINLPDHVQSWFIGLSNKVINTDFITEFMQTIKHQDKKMDVVYKYECGLGNLIRNNNLQVTCFINDDNAGFNMLEKPVSMLTDGMPFIKKQSLRLVPHINILRAFTDDIFYYEIIENIQRCEIKLGNKYNKKFRFALFGVPLISVYKKFDDAKYKVLLFDKFPIAVIYNNKEVK